MHEKTSTTNETDIIKIDPLKSSILDALGTDILTTVWVGYFPDNSPQLKAFEEAASACDTDRHSPIANSYLENLHIYLKPYQRQYAFTYMDYVIKSLKSRQEVEKKAISSEMNTLLSKAEEEKIIPPVEVKDLRRRIEITSTALNSAISEMDHNSGLGLFERQANRQPHLLRRLAAPVVKLIPIRRVYLGNFLSIPERKTIIENVEKGLQITAQKRRLAP